ncbi:hypothetical protein CSB45_06025 [candidate division KSB3 bacterium]|uniref:histidine kinase n=1 Tax=candidate division KSB3 bacterium TaxID=2044937 RepID=A0A2G6E7P5_9BACT|nr:MAG: hypothetical protein CSB45_06025 [candidate division KSB3 bacterium]PIE30206.1 MAG: hypothetical protein CSA57_04740 [candidate division KSB3 bacterium]
MISNDILVLKGLGVSVGRLQLLQDINLRIKRGDIHAIIGDHGAGKSTLAKVLSGLIPVTCGTVCFEGQILGKYGTKQAATLGIHTVYQNGNLLQNMTVLENIFLNRELKTLLVFPDNRRMREMAEEVFQDLRISLDLNRLLETYDFAQQQLVELVRIACFPSKLLIIDEISNKLLPKDIEKLHYLISILRQGGTTVLYISRNMDEILNFANRVTILNKGRIVETADISHIDKLQLVQLTYSSMSRREQLEQNNLELFYLNNFNKSLINNLPFPLMVTDSKQCIVTMNRSFEQVTDVHHRDFAGKPVEHIFDFPESTQTKHFHNTRHYHGIQVRGPQQTAGAVVDVHIIPFMDEDGSFMGTLYTLSKTTGVEQFEHVLQSNDVSKDPRKMLAEVAHEINNPLGIMLNYVKLIATGNETEQIRLNAGVIEKEIKRIKRFLRDITETKEVPDAQLSEKACIGDIIEEVAIFLQPMLDGNHVQLDIDEEREIFLDCDPDLMKQVILNIMLNGIEAMPEGGRLRVAVFLRELEGKMYSAIEIRDTGIGIPAETLERIFEPFYTTKSTGESFGLGLSLSQDIITQLQGFITVESRVYAGATFQIFIPFE